MRGLLLALLLLFLPVTALAQEPSVCLTEDVIVSITLPTVQVMSLQGLAFLKEVEQFRPKAYRDARGYSIGYGFQTWQGRPVTPTYPRRVTVEEAEAELLRQIEKYEAIVRAEFQEQIPQHAFDALVSIAFNLGRVNTSILDKVAKGRPVTVQDFVTTAKARSKFSPVVFARRVREFMVFLGRYDHALDMQFESLSQARRAYRALMAHSLIL